MKTGRKQVLAAAAALAFVVLPGLAVANDKKETADTMITVYISAHGGSSIAKKANETHVKMEAAGWRFANMEVHTENADTEGAWLTYVK